MIQPRASKATQKGILDITRGIESFLGCLDRVFASTFGTLAVVLKKAKEAPESSFNYRQVLMLKKLLNGLDEKLNRRNGKNCIMLPEYSLK